MVSTRTALDNLAARINDEFLTCKICYETFKHPKCLSCLHTFCRSCIEKNMLMHQYSSYTRYRDFSCPLCRKKTQIPAGGASRLQDNFLVESLNDLVCDKLIKADMTRCDLCTQSDNATALQALAKCIDCQKALCETCLKSHKQNLHTANHDVYDISIENDIKCSVHPNEVVRYFCTDCDQCICIVCACGTSCCTKSHSNHHLTNFRLAAAHRRPQLIDRLNACRNKETELDNNIKRLDKLKEVINKARECISTTAQQYHRQIEQQEEKLIIKLDETMTPQTKQMLENIPSLQEIQEQLGNTCSLTELVLAGGDIELMMMAHKLSDKLEMLHETKVDINQVNENDMVVFKTGKVHLGSIVGGSKYFDSVTNQQTVADETTEAPINGIDVALQTTCDDYDQLKKPGGNTNNFNKRLQGKFLTDFVDSRNIINSIGQCVIENNEISPESERDDICGNEETKKNINESIQYTHKKINRLLKKNCSVAVLPNGDTMVLDPTSNCLIFLNKQGKILYFLSDDACANPTTIGVGNFKTLSVSDGKFKREVNIQTPQGKLSVNFQESGDRMKLPLAFTVHAYNSMSMDE